MRCLACSAPWGGVSHRLAAHPRLRSFACSRCQAELETNGARKRAGDRSSSRHAILDVCSVIACIVKTRERFMGVGQVLTMPLFFASNAVYPTTMMPAWLRVISIWIRRPALSMLCGHPCLRRSEQFRHGFRLFGYSCDYRHPGLDRRAAVSAVGRVKPTPGWLQWIRKHREASQERTSIAGVKE